MTLDERIEAAARALYECNPEMDQPVDPDNRPTGPAVLVSWKSAREARPREAGGIRDDARAVLTAAFPELFTSPPTGWIAPWEAAEGMVTAMSDLDSNGRYEWLRWSGARDAYLNREGK